MNASYRTLLAILFCGVSLVPSASLDGAELRGKGKSSSTLNITRDQGTGKIIVSWSGKGVLKQAAGLNGHYKPVRKSLGGVTTYVVEPTGDQAVYRLESASSPVISVNVVGYVNLQLPPGLSLIANPLFYTNNAVATWLPNAPDGAQVFKYTAGGGFEVSTFDGGVSAWSNPEQQVPLGIGFYFNNPSTETFTYTFVGEVLQGTLINPLPAGVSTKGSLVPQAGSINSVHQIAGEPGDEIRLYTNDGRGGGAYQNSIFTMLSATESAWLPDLELGVGQGFWIQKQNAQDWVRVFFVN